MDIDVIIFALGTGKYRVTLHAKKRMAERNITHADIRRCAITARIIESKDGKVKLEGFDLDDILLTLICVEDCGVLIITVF